MLQLNYEKKIRIPTSKKQKSSQSPLINQQNRHTECQHFIVKYLMFNDKQCKSNIDPQISSGSIINTF